MAGVTLFVLFHFSERIQHLFQKGHRPSTNLQEHLPIDECKNSEGGMDVPKNIHPKEPCEFLHNVKGTGGRTEHRVGNGSWTARDLGLGQRPGSAM